MGLYAEKLMEAVRTLNDPIKTTSKTVLETPNEPLDITSLLMMLALSGIFKGKDKTTSSLNDVINIAPALGPMNSGGGFMGGITPVANNPFGGGQVPGTNTKLPDFLQILQSLFSSMPGPMSR